MARRCCKVLPVLLAVLWFLLLNMLLVKVQSAHAHPESSSLDDDNQKAQPNDQAGGSGVVDHEQNVCDVDEGSVLVKLDFAMEFGTLRVFVRLPRQTTGNHVVVATSAYNLVWSLCGIVVVAAFIVWVGYLILFLSGNLTEEMERLLNRAIPMVLIAFALALTKVLTECLLSFVT